MTTSHPIRHLLGAGLGPYGADFGDLKDKVPGAEIKEIVARNLKKANAYGFICDNVIVNPFKPEEGIEVFKKAITSKHWDVVLIGYGVRRSDQLTILLQIMINACHELSPHSKIIFDAAPGEVWPALKLAYPEELGGCD